MASPSTRPEEQPPLQETNIDQVIKDSKNVLSKKDTKSKRGRPAGSKKRPESSPQSEPAKASDAGSPAPVYTPGPMVPAFKNLYQMAFRIPANKYKCPEVNLTDEEAEAPAIATDQLLNAFTPDLNAMSPKTTACVQFVVVVGMLCLSKRMILSEHQARTEPKVERPGPLSNKKAIEEQAPRDEIELKSKPTLDEEPWGPPPTGSIPVKAEQAFPSARSNFRL